MYKKRYKYLVIYDEQNVPYFVTVYTKKELKIVKNIMKKNHYYKIEKNEPFIEW